MTKKTILITGASARLGLYLITHYLNDHHVIALSRSSSPALDALSSNPNLSIYQTNPESEQSIKSTIKQLNTDFQNIDLIVHNASRFELDEDHTEDEWQYYDSLVAVHMKLPFMLNNGLHNLLTNTQTTSNIIHISDISVDNPSPEKSLYISTKAASQNLAISFAKKFAPTIRVNTIQPGPMLYADFHTQEHKDKVQSQTLLKANPGFEPILQTIEYIQNCQFITGSTIKVDGGRSLLKS